MMTMCSDNHEVNLQPCVYGTCMCVQVGASDLPVIGQTANGVDYLQSELGTAISAFKGVYSAYEDAFCTPASYTPPVLMPANLTGGSPTLLAS